MIDTRKFQREAEIKGDSKHDTDLLKKMASEVRSYLYGFTWCPSIKNIYLAYGVGGIVGLFFVEMAESIRDTDQSLWVVVGDLPTAYLVTDIEKPREALVQYLSLMESWIEAVKFGRSLVDEFPTGVDPTAENSLSLQKRIKFIRTNVLPNMN